MAATALKFLSLALLSIAFLSSSSSAHNITRLLSNYPSFSSFNSLLTSTKLADDINSRRTITVLVVSDASINGVAGLSPDLQRKILSIHVILDYFDLEKLQNLKHRSTILTTLFQTSGIAENRTGFLNVTKFYDGRVAFGSAASGAGLVADMVGPVASRPYNISVLQVSSIIIPPGIDGLSHNSTLPPPSHPSPADAETPSPAVTDPEAPAPTAEAPDTEAEAPAADAPTEKAAPSDAPVADSPEVDEEVKSGSGMVGVGGSIAALMGALLIACL